MPSSSFFKNKKILVFVLASFVFHLLTFVILHSAANSMTPKAPLPQKILVQLNQKLPEKIADISKPAIEEVPEKASVQSLYNQKVKKETVNPNTTKPPPKNVKSQQSNQTNTKKFSQQKTAQQSAPQNNSQRIPGMPGSAVSTPSSSDDYLPYYQYGDRTYINALANPNISYYIELYRKFKLAWNPFPSVKRNLDKISGPHLTVRLGVSIDQQGNLVEVRILKSSGIVEYDSEGRRTVKTSAPFSAPPSHLEFQNGLHHMAWNFIVTL